MTDTIRAADALARRLHAAGCRFAFGMPGGEVLTIVDALERAGIRFVLAKHENAAAFMAEAAWHRSGAPGILVATVGPGLLNGVNAIANAHQDRVPLIVLAGSIDSDEAETYTHQVLDQRAVLAPITKATFGMTAGAAHVQADKAVSLALEGRMGPVYVDVPISVADAKLPAAAPAARVAAAQTGLSGDDLALATGWLTEARRPLMIAGVDAMNQGAEPAIAAFCERYGIALITSYKAKGTLPEDHPLCLGGAGLSPLADRHLLPLVQSADLILCAGYDPIEMRPGWRDPWDPAQQRVIDIAPVPNDHYMHQATLNVIGPVAPTLHALSSASPQDTWPGGEVAACKTALAEAFPADAEWGPNAIVDVCRSTLPQDTLATADSGAHRILLSQQWTCYEPRGLMQSSGLCTMGCALPLAIGAALMEPDRPVISFSGDAGFLMIAGELATAAELKLKPIFLVFVDGALALIEKKQRERQLANAGVDFAVHDFAAMGRAFGGAGVDVRDRDSLRTALTDAMTAPTFTVIAAHIDKGAYDGRI
ncbi:thiamine pyrophosphate-binding protein [Aliishimia ponticola]|uniref:Thiamine pyrophosphate-binding protein n=1 Tax=Aliishimia ponticola TaxID=2499833 RepID=A0A4S4N9U8_9RHOB|nr:thiamine pyrophosphate-binding protein [Aliishimia ponticola]THH35969.1 thiamine pyrophosphate-binding protein [Aliishimia ponticola]